MAAPNIVAVTTIRGKSNVANLTTTSSSVVVNDVNSGKVFKINTIIVSNVDGTNSGNVTVELFKFGAQNVNTGTGNTVYSLANVDRKSTRLNSSHIPLSRMPSSA